MSVAFLLKCLRSMFADLVGGDPIDPAEETVADRHSAETRAKIARGRGTAVKKSMVRQAALAVVSTAVHVASTAWGTNPQEARAHVDFVATADGPIAVTGDRKRTAMADRNSVLVSHVKAQAAGVARFMSDERQKVMQFVNIFDDASMWVAKPPSLLEKEALLLGVDPAKVKAISKHTRKRNMMHAPVLNLEERISKLVDVNGTPCVAGLSLYSPAQVLPKANYATVLDRWRRWTVCNGHKPGSGIDGYGELLNVFDGPHWRNISIVRDCLMLKSNVVAKVEESCKLKRDAIDGSADADGVPTVFSCNCCCHRCVLCLKPILTKYDGLASSVVRCGHLCQSWRSSTRYTKALEEEIERSFQWKPVLRFPDEYPRWHSAARKVLDLRGLGELTPDQRSETLMYDNGCWSEEDIVPYCIEGCACGRARAGALARTMTVVKTPVGPHCPLALEYRRKYMEKTNAWCFRIRAQHNLGERAFRRAYSQKNIDEAEGELSRAVAAGGIVKSSGTKQTVKAGRVITYMRNDPGGRSSLKLLILQKPLQRCLNRLFKAKTSTTEFQEATACVPPVVRPEVVQLTTEKLSAAVDRNLPILLTDIGKRVVRDYGEEVRNDFHPIWPEMNFSREELFSGSCQMVCAAGVAYRRLVLYFIQPKFDVLAATQKDVRPDDIEGIEGPIRERLKHCKACSEYYTTVWLARLSGRRARVMAKARDALRVQVAELM